MFLSLRFAGRELRAGLGGFGVFLACLALGVAAIAATGSTAEALRFGLARQSRDILGGDLAVTIEQRRFTLAEQSALSAAGKVALATSTEAMAQAPSGRRQLVELRGVSDSYPLVGAVQLEGGGRLADALALRAGAAGAAVEKSLLNRLGLRLGERFLIGNTAVIATAVLLSEPDRLSRSFALGPRVLTRASTLAEGGFLEPGLPFAQTARIALSPGGDPSMAAAAVRRALQAAGPGGFTVHDRHDAAPGLRKMIDLVEFFLGFVGLVSLVAGGLGISGAVSAYIARKTAAIGVLKTFGADGGLVRNVYLIQIGVMAAAGIAIGLLIGAAAPVVLGQLFAGQLPVPALFAVYPAPLLRAAGFGALAATAFSLAPLGRTRTTPPSVLFREQAPGRAQFSMETAGALLAGAGLAALAVATAPTPIAAAVMMAGVIAAFALLAGLGRIATRCAAGLRGRLRGPALVGIANLAGPGSAAQSVAPAIGLGVALLSAVVLVQGSLLNQVAKITPTRAPSVVFTAIPGSSGARFDAVLARAFKRPLTPTTFLRAPLATGRLVGVRGAPIDLSQIDPSARWAYDRDIPISALGAQPANAGVTGGHWWPEHYQGPPLVALSTDVARGARLQVGDAVTIAILGRNIEAHIAVLRRIDFGGFGANFGVIVDSHALAGADLDEIAIARATANEERDAVSALGSSFPLVNVIDLRDQLSVVSGLFERLALTINGLSGIAMLAGLLVMLGAISARAVARKREAATLRVLGASSGQILAIYTLEYGSVGLIAGLGGVGLGYAAAWLVVTKGFHLTWSADWPGVAVLIMSATAVASLAGLIAALHALNRRGGSALSAS